MAKVKVDADAPTRVRWLVQVQAPGAGPVGSESMLPLKVASQYALLEWCEPVEPLGDLELRPGVEAAFDYLEGRRRVMGDAAFYRAPAFNRQSQRLLDLLERVA